jgi:hypothetical protein
MHKQCNYCGIDYDDFFGGVHFCSRVCQRRYNAKAREQWLKTHTAWEYMTRNWVEKPTEYIKLNPNDETAKLIKKQFAHNPNTMEMMLKKHREELKLKQSQLAGYRYSDAKLQT